MNMQAGSFQEPWEVSVGEEGKGHSMQKGQRQKRCGNQHCGKSRKTIMNGEGAKLKTATGIRGSSVSDSNTIRGSSVSDSNIFHDLDWCAQCL